MATVQEQQDQAREFWRMWHKSNPNTPGTPVLTRMLEFAADFHAYMLEQRAKAVKRIVSNIIGAEPAAQPSAANLMHRPKCCDNGYFGESHDCQKTPSATHREPVDKFSGLPKVSEKRCGTCRALLVRQTIAHVCVPANAVESGLEEAARAMCELCHSGRALVLRHGVWKHQSISGEIYHHCYAHAIWAIRAIAQPEHVVYSKDGVTLTNPPLTQEEAEIAQKTASVKIGETKTIIESLREALERPIKVRSEVTTEPDRHDNRNRETATGASPNGYAQTGEGVEGPSCGHCGAQTTRESKFGETRIQTIYRCGSCGETIGATQPTEEGK